MCPVLYRKASSAITALYWALLIVGLPCVGVIPVLVCFILLTDPGTLPKSIGNVEQSHIEEAGPPTACVPIAPSLLESPGEKFTVKPHCAVCGALRLDEPQAHHCRLCDHCVSGFDHHCGFLNVCIGRRNRTYFVVLLMVLASVLNLLLVSSVTAASFAVVNSTKLDRWFLYLPMLPLFAATTFFNLFAAFHLYLIVTGSTTYNWRKQNPSFLTSLFSSVAATSKPISMDEIIDGEPAKEIELHSLLENSKLK